MVYIGVDLHRKRSQLAAMDEAGELLFNRSIPSESRAFLRVFGELAPEPIAVAFEATIGWGWFADLLADAGVEAHMAHPLATRAVATARVKNDAVDAKTLAHLLRTHLLPEAWIAPLAWQSSKASPKLQLTTNLVHNAIVHNLPRPPRRQTKGLIRAQIGPMRANLVPHTGCAAFRCQASQPGWIEHV